MKNVRFGIYERCCFEFDAVYTDGDHIHLFVGVLHIGLDLTQLDDDKVRSAFTSADIEAMVTSIGVDFAGDRTVMALARPDGMFKVVSKVWYCPEDKTERFWSRGICPVHGCELKQV